MTYSSSDKWIVWGKPEDGVRLIKWCYSQRTALTRYGRNTRFYGKRIAVPLEKWQQYVTQSLGLIQADMEGF